MFWFILAKNENRKIFVKIGKFLFLEHFCLRDNFCTNFHILENYRENFRLLGIFGEYIHEVQENFSTGMYLVRKLLVTTVPL